MAKKKGRGVTLASLKLDETYVPIYLNGDEDEDAVDVWYVPSEFTLDMTDEVDDDNPDGNLGVLSEMLTRMISRWELYADDEAMEAGTPLPVSLATFRKFPMHWLMNLRNGILEDYVPKYMRTTNQDSQNASQNGSAPTGIGT